MTFQANIPQANTFISVSQGDILNNFGQIDTSWNVNHVGFNAGATTGKHKFVEMPNQGSDPAGSVTEMTLFSKLAAGVSQIFYKRDNAGSSFQLTGPGDPNANQTGHCFLPGGIILNWGFGTASIAGTAQVFNLAFPNAQWGTVVSVNQNTGTSITVWSDFPNTSLSQFIAKASANGTSIFYFSIGN